MNISFNQLRSMRYGICSIGSYVHVKLRYTAELVDRIARDKELHPYKNDITIMFNKSRTYGHIAFISHQNTGLVQILQRVERRQRAILAAEKASKILESRE